jgi:predicted signal transduction protein with EAL and GGDEF domain
LSTKGVEKKDWYFGLNSFLFFFYSTVRDVRSAKVTGFASASGTWTVSALGFIPSMEFLLSW